MYNVFKRPMFKLGGQADQGTGIMSTVEPKQTMRQNPYTGYAIGGRIGLQKGTGKFDFFFPEVVTDQERATRSDLYPFEKRDSEELLNALSYTPLGRAGSGLNILKQAGKYGAKNKPDFYTGVSGQAQRTLEDAPFLSNQYIREAVRPYASGAAETLKQAGTGIKDFARKYGIATGLGLGGAGTIYGALNEDGTPPPTETPFFEAEDTSRAATILPSETATDAVFNRAKEKASLRAEKGKKLNDVDTKLKPEPEETFDSVYQKEFDKLEKVIGKDDDSKGLLALAISEAIGTPGTIADKSKVLNKYLFKIAGERKSDRRDIAKLAYSATKQIEAAKIAAGKEGYSEKLANEIRQYQGTINNPNASQQAKDFARQQIGIIGNTMKVLNPPKEGLTSTDASLLQNFQKTVNNLEKEPDKNSDKYKKLLQKYLTERDTILTFIPNAQNIVAGVDQRIGIAKKDGGRIGFAKGSSLMPKETMQTVGQGQTPTAEVDSLSFEQLRSRLPEEITDDVVNLLASSNQALQDFAYIRTQGDVNKFNQKYGVSLILPATA
jgi:hypothetical protein